MPSLRHEERRAWLDVIARVAGFTTAISVPGCSPDVLRADPICGAIFLGDAKDTERPTNDETYWRLSTYMQWFKVAIEDGGRASVFALWFGDRRDLAGWIAVLHGLAADARLPVYRVRVRRIAESDTVTWIDFAPQVGNKACGHGLGRC